MCVCVCVCARNVFVGHVNVTNMALHGSRTSRTLECDFVPFGQAPCDAFLCSWSGGVIWPED